MPDVVQLGRMVKAKYPGVYDDLPDGVVGQKVKAKFPGAYDDFADTSYTPPTAKPPEQSTLGAMLSGGAEAAGQYIVEPAVSLYQAGKAAIGGNFQPLGQMAESAGRGALKVVSAFDPAGNAYEPTAAEQNPRLAELQRQREQRLSQTPAGQYVQKRRAELAAEAARDQTTGNKVARGVGRFLGAAAPAVATGALTGGSLPAIAGTTALQSAAAPENAALNVGLSVAPIPAGQIVKSATNAIRRVFGKGAAQIIEAEAAGAALPSAGGAASPTVQRAMQQFEQEVARIKTLPPAQQAAEMQTAIQGIGREASGIRPVSAETRRGYPPAIQEFPANPNPIQVAGELPRAPGAAAETGAGAAIRPSQQARGVSMPAHSLKPGDVIEYQTGFPPRTVQGEVSRVQFDPATQQMVPIVKAGNGEFPAVEYLESGRVVSPTAAMRGPANVAPMETTPPAPAGQYGLGLSGMGRELGDALRRTLRESVKRTGKLPSAERGSSIGKAYEAAVASGEPRSVATLDKVLSGDVGPPPLSAEIGAPQSFGVKAAPDLAYSETVGPSASAPMDLNATVAQATKSLPVPKMERFKDELLGLLSLPKSLRSTLDISYPLRQGAILLLRPFQWRQSRKVIVDMFRGFKTKNFEAINQAIENHPLAGRMEAAGVHINEPGGGPLRGEEALSRPQGSKIAEFVTQKAGKYVGIKQSDQAFTTAGNVQRVEAFQQYANAIDKAGLSPEQVAIADKAAAQWVNITTGRGSLGKGIDKAFEALNYAFFSPRYVASRLNILNPVMYARNFATPGGRVVLRQQMGDLLQYLSVVGTTLYLAKQSGADVTLNPHNPDFGKIKFGTRRYDLGAGLSQAIRATYLIGEDLIKALQKEKPDYGKTAIDVGKTFLEYKLSPPAGVFRDLLSRRTVNREPFTYTGAARDLVVPMQWADFVDAYQKEVWGGVAKSLPGIVGVGVQNYKQTPVDAAIERAQPLFMELKRLDKQVSDLRKQTKQEFKNGKWVSVENEDDASFQLRVQQFGQNYTLYGLQLLDSPRFRQAPDSVKVLALDALNERAKKLTTAEFPFPELTLDADALMESAEVTAAKRTK